MLRHFHLTMNGWFNTYITSSSDFWSQFLLELELKNYEKSRISGTLLAAFLYWNWKGSWNLSSKMFGSRLKILELEFEGTWNLPYQTWNLIIKWPLWLSEMRTWRCPNYQMGKKGELKKWIPWLVHWSDFCKTLLIDFDETFSLTLGR